MRQKMHNIAMLALLALSVGRLSAHSMTRHNAPRLPPGRDLAEEAASQVFRSGDSEDGALIYPRPDMQPTGLHVHTSL